MTMILLSLAMSTAGSGQYPSPPEAIPAPSTPSMVLSAPIQSPPITVEQFARNFVPTPGVHDVLFIHPYSKKAVDVAFRLPAGPIYKVNYGKNRVTFDYGRTKVVLIFRLIGGKVEVRYA